MSQAGASSNHRARKTLPPLERYKRLNLFEQLICYYYWLYIISGGNKGWDNKKAGWKEQWNIKTSIKTKYTYSAFYNLGKSMVVLAQNLATSGHYLDKPNISGTPTEDDDECQINQQEDYTAIEEVREDNYNNPPFYKDKEDTGEETIIMPCKSSLPNKSSPSSSNRMKASDASEKISSGNDHTLLFITVNDIEFSWIHPRKSKIKVAWPDWWVNPEQQAEFDANEETGVPVYGIDHQLIGEIIENRKEEDGRVWDKGYFMFDQEMSTNPAHTIICLKYLEVESTGQFGQFISVKTMVNLQEAKKQTPMKAKKSVQTAKPGTGGAGKTSNLTWKKAVQENDMDTTVGNSATDQNTGQNVKTRVGRTTTRGRQTRSRSRSRVSTHSISSFYGSPKENSIKGMDFDNNL